MWSSMQKATLATVLLVGLPLVLGSGTNADARICSPTQEFPRDSTCNRQGMSRQDGDLPQYALRLVEDAELPQHCPSVVIDFFPG